MLPGKQFIKQLGKLVKNNNMKTIDEIRGEFERVAKIKADSEAELLRLQGEYRMREAFDKEQAKPQADKPAKDKDLTFEADVKEGKIIDKK
jgi:hypothetical protein